MKPTAIYVIASVLILLCAGSAAAWYDGYGYRIPLNIDNTGGSALTNYQMNVSLTGIDADSIRVVNETAGAAIPHWCETVTGDDCYEAWFNVTYLPAGVWTNDTYFIYYHKYDAACTSDFDDTFTKEHSDTGLVLELHMDDGTGNSVAVDTSGEGNDGVLTGMSTIGDVTSGWQGVDGGQWDGQSDATFSTGDLLRFDGMNDHLDCGNDGSLDVADTITLSAWMKFDDRTGDQKVFAKGIDAMSVYQMWTVDGYLAFGFYSGGWILLMDDTTQMENDVWYHVAATYNTSLPSDNIKLFINGVQINQQTESTAMQTDAGNLLIGKRINGQFFYGDCDETCVYNRTLSGDEIYRQYVRSQYTANPPSISLGARELGTYPAIHLVGVTPDPLYTNNTVDVDISFGVHHNTALNTTSTAILSALNYTADTNGYNYYSQIRYPATDIAAADPTGAIGNVFRGVNRNITPYLTFEENDTITGGDVYKWSGYDYNDAHVSFNAVNSTYTYVNVSTCMLETFATFKYIDADAIFAATKTSASIDRSQSLIMKAANLEEVLLRDDNYTVSLYFDTVASSSTTHPSDDLIVYCANSSFDPLVDDFTTSANACLVDTIDYTDWRTPGTVGGKCCVFAETVFAGDQLTFDPTAIMYVCIASGTQSSKPYLLNMTNDAIVGVNRSFAQTDSLWTINELSGVSTATAYTANIMAKFNRRDEQIEYKMFIADAAGNWGESCTGIHTIDDSNIAPTKTVFTHFNTTCGGVYIDDVEMDATYDNGMMYIGMYTSIDPDGGVVTNNLTLHRSTGEYVTTINNTFGDGGAPIEIAFSTTPYYSTSLAYTLKCVSTDDEGTSATSWLGNNFTLAADGTTGNVVSSDLVWFWGYNNIHALYIDVADTSVISLSGGIYTMHVPFFKSKCNDTFTFDDDVHLRSNGGDDIAYFRAHGTIYFDDCDIRAWNTVTDSVATEYGPTEHRAYLLFIGYLDGHINNCDMSYLGTDVYRQEGINFVDISDFEIEGSTFGHNSRGIIFENCDNMTLSGCTCSDNFEVGTGIYFTGNTTVSGGVYNHNGHSDDNEASIRSYQSLYGVIEDTTVSDSALHGIWLQYCDHVVIDTCGVAGSASGRDYYLSSYSNNNTITDATQSFNIRTTSSSDVNITTTDNKVYTETSQYTQTITPVGSYMLHHGISATFSVGVVDMYITPHGGSLVMPTFVWAEETTFTLDTSDPITYVEIDATRSDWVYNGMWLDVGGEFYDSCDAGPTGNVAYNYTGGFAVSPLTFSIHERILEGWQALGQDTTESYTDLVTIIGICVLIVIVGGIIIGLRSFAGDISPEILIIVAIAIGLGLLVLVTMVEVIPSVMAPMENITMEGL